MNRSEVLLSGCGNIGFRHLQALLTLDEPCAVTVVEPSPAHHDRIRTEAALESNEHHSVEIVANAPVSSRHFDLAINATTASVRRPVVEEVLTTHSVSALLLEKVLFQTTADLDAVEAMIERLDVPTYVNCGRRSFDGYRRLREQIDGSPVDIRVPGRRLGLASNAIHFLDLAEYINRSRVVAVEANDLEPGARPARHHGCVELFGTLDARLANGAQLRVTSEDSDPVTVVVELDGSDGVTVIDELARTIDSPGRPSEPFDSQNVSESTQIYADLLADATCDLTPYVESAHQHRLYLDAVRRHLGLSIDADEPCPIS